MPQKKTSLQYQLLYLTILRLILPTDPDSFDLCKSCSIASTVNISDTCSKE